MVGSTLVLFFFSSNAGDIQLSVFPWPSLFPKLVHVLLLILLGFCLFRLSEKPSGRILLTAGIGLLIDAADKSFQYFSGRSVGWLGAAADFAVILIGAGLSALSMLFLRFLKKWIQRGSSDHIRRLEGILDVAALSTVLHYAAYRFLQSTTFRIYYSDRYKTITILALAFAGVLRLAYYFLKTYWACGNEKRKALFVSLRFALALGLAVPFFAVGVLHGYRILFFFPLAAMCLYRMEPEKVFRAFFYTIGTLLLGTVLCCLSGTVSNLISPYKNVYSSYGIINTTDFAAYFVFLPLAYWCGMRTRKWYISVLFAAVSAMVALLVYRLSGSHTSLICGLMIAAFALWECVEEKLLWRFKPLGIVKKGVDLLATLAFPLIGLILIILLGNFGRQIPWALDLDELLSGRIRLTWNMYQAYGIHPLGAFIEKMHGNGGTVFNNYWNENYNYLDIGYAMLMIRYGWVISGIVCVLWEMMSFKSLRYGKNRIVFSLAVIAVHAFSEARILDMNYNVFLAMPFCAFTCIGKNETSPADSSDAAEAKTKWFSLSLGIALLGVVYLILPKALSWLRTFFALKGWNVGTRSFYSLVFCVSIVIVAYAVYKTALRLWYRRNKQSFALLAATVFALTGAGWYVNHVIEQGLSVQAHRLDSEKQMIRQVQEAAQMPVYAAEASELYQRSIGGFSEHLFTSEELNRWPKGSLFTDASVEVSALTWLSGWYTQISEWSGLYSFDRSVIRALEALGYEWKPYYTGKKTCDLKDTAIFNGMKPDEPLTLNGPARIITHNMAQDQFSATYAVSFSLKLLESTSEAFRCQLEVLGENGEKSILTEQVGIEDFDSEGRCIKTLQYTISSTPGIVFAVSTEDGVNIAVEDISWWFVS